MEGWKHLHLIVESSRQTWCRRKGTYQSETPRWKEGHSEIRKTKSKEWIIFIDSEIFYFLDSIHMIHFQEILEESSCWCWSQYGFFKKNCKVRKKFEGELILQLGRVMSSVHNAHEYVIRKRDLLLQCKCLRPNFFCRHRTRNHKGYPEIIILLNRHTRWSKNEEV